MSPRTTRSVIVLSHCNKTSKEINEFFGSKNVLSIKNAKKTSLKKKTKVTENSFLKMFSPTVKSYSDRSLLVTPTKNKSKIKNYGVVDQKPFVKPLYWNKTLGGWITSKDNLKVLKSSPKNTKKSSSKVDFNEMFVPQVVSYSDRALLVTPTKNKSKVKSYSVVEQKPFVKPLYWNKTLGGWITSKDNESYFNTEPSSQFNLFMSHFKPTVESYTDRSLVLRATKNKTKAKDWPCVEGSPLVKPMYWNQTVGGWVTSKDNSSLLGVSKKSKIKVDYSYLTTISKKDQKELENYVLQKYKRGLLLKSKKKQKSPEKYFHNGFWNQSLGGWVYSSKEKKNLVSKGAVFM